MRSGPMVRALALAFELAALFLGVESALVDGSAGLGLFTGGGADECGGDEFGEAIDAGVAVGALGSAAGVGEGEVGVGEVAGVGGDESAEGAGGEDGGEGVAGDGEDGFGGAFVNVLAAGA